MTYCIGMLLDGGLVLMADTRTNAGVDNFSCYKKLHTLANGGDRYIFAATSGSLSVTQSVVGLLDEGLPGHDGSDGIRHLDSVPSMFRAAQLVGEAVQTVRAIMEPALSRQDVNSNVSLLLGGRVGTEQPRLFLIYSAGNFIECQPESPFFQIGETKYGRPILDRGVNWSTPLPLAVKIAFLSFDSTMRSNLGVARPIDLVVLPADTRAPLLTRRIQADDEYFNTLSMDWAQALAKAALAIPNPPFMEGFDAPDSSA
ncbi:peptidase [Allosphingosinicella flava]|uniref:Peptidase n=1 Tax=Allosphingosinicella flava TaxID=2771430 RepID=A0A7T2GHS4_9SPHN|nr:peptidase [Sphingosinicella flava]QPQ54134.1 peptidase [Sphingosinicella flava]